MASDASNPQAFDKSSAPSAVTTGPQFEEALQTAEALLRRADDEREKADRALAAAVGIVAIAIAAVVSIVAIDHSSPWRFLLLAIGVGYAGLLAASPMSVVRRRLLSQSKRDEQAAIDIVSLLREVIELIPDTEKWSETQLRLARARLSRFPVGRYSYLEE